MTTPNSTIRKLADITDAALFERLATDVLRSCKPSLYEHLSHPGVNPDGKTVKAPLDGVGYVQGSNGNRIVAVAHSTCDQNDIEKKWLHDQTTVKPRKAGNKPTAPEGDLRKAIFDIKAIRVTQPKLQATVALTSNREPNQQSILAAQRLATDSHVNLEIWSASKIAQFLDSPKGQWIRKLYLGDPVEYVSIELLQSCTKRCLLEYAHLQNPLEFVNRTFTDEQLSGHTLLVGSSGVGKTTIAIQILKNHYEKGGVGLVIPHETIILATNLAEAIDIELRKLEPYLEPNAGLQALSVSTYKLPFVVVIEDANAASDPPTILNKVVGWTAANTQSHNGNNINEWRMVCPVWPRYVDSLKQQLKEKQGVVLQSVDVYTDEQANEAIRKRSLVVGRKLLPATISSIATALGNDPLLIALCDFSSTPDAAKEVERYIEKELARVASNSANLHLTDIKDAIDTLVRNMLINKRLSPSLREINDWFRQENQQLQTLRFVLKSGSVLKLTLRDGDECLIPRHDRVLLSLFSHTIGKDLLNGTSEQRYFIDPFFSEALGLTIANTQIVTDKLKWLIEQNPLSLFHAFQIAARTSAKTLPTIINCIIEWLSKTESQGRQFNSLRFRALQILAETDSPEVLALTDLFRHGDRYENWCRARFRNGDIGAGLALLTLYDSFGVRVQGRRELLAHSFARFGSKIVESLQKLLTDQSLNSRSRMGSLFLAGYLGDSALAPAIHTSWTCAKPEDRDLTAYLWAAARCKGEGAENTLELICDAWAELPDDKEGEFNCSITSLAAHEISWEFRRYLPLNAIPYFVQRANTDKRLNWPITYMMRNFDHPFALEHVTKFLAESDRNKQPDTFYFASHSLLNEWSRDNDHSIQMSASSKTRLLELAFDSNNDIHLRKSAFIVWDASKTPGDVEQIRQTDKTSDLYEKAIWARVKRGDKTAISPLIELIPKNPRYWWQAGRYLWSDEMTEALEKSIKNAADVLKTQNTIESDIEWILAEMLMELDKYSAERILLQEWDNLKNSPRFVQAAMYFATPQLTQMVKKVVAESTEPANLFKYVISHMGWKTQGRKGITRFEQVELICNYIEHLSEHDIYELWDICNGHGWIEFRKSYLDAIISKSEHYGYLNIIDLKDLDSALAGKSLGATSFWIERHMRNGNTLPELMDALFGWLQKNQTVRALEVLADIFYASARRCDLERLQEYTKTWSAIDELMADLVFTVKHRTLN